MIEAMTLETEEAMDWDAEADEAAEDSEEATLEADSEAAELMLEAALSVELVKLFLMGWRGMYQFGQ